MRRQLCFVIAIVFLVGPWSPAYAWGPKGHRIVALIAEAHLTPAAKQAVADLLDVETDPRIKTLADAATWPDLIKGDRPETKPWHFVDILIADNEYDETRDCAGGNCIIAKIAEFRATLRDHSASMEDRLEALKFITHFVGDLHQPLHCADNHDRGGNEVAVKWFGKKMNLHSVWDSGIIDRAGLDEEDFAGQLLADINSAETPDLQAGAVVDWANATHRLAKPHAYALPQNRFLGQNYYSKHADITDAQLTKAGLRLARILNESFGSITTAQ